jgi:hypothetical protein
MVLNDWLRGKIPFYTAPPEDEKPATGMEVEEPIPIIEGPNPELEKVSLLYYYNDSMMVTNSN